MTDVTVFGAAVGLVSLAVTAAVLSSRLSAWIRVPAPALFLIVAAVAADLFPPLGRLSIGAVQQVVTIALVVILFDGGMHIGWRRFRAAAAPIVWLGVAGTVVTSAAVAVLAHMLCGFGWQTAILLGAALAPTDPAVVFSVLGRREIGGRSGAILEGESGANDPVGIAIMVSLLAASGHGGGGLGAGLLEFALEMVVGAAVGLLGGWALLAFMRRVALPSEGLYAVRTLAGAGLIYGAATVVHGSGFLAVFIAGILLGDAGAPYKREIERFHSSLASIGEMVAFTLLGLTVSVRSLPNGHAWQIGLLLAALLAFVVRPLLVGALLLPIRLRRGEKLFILWSGLKGAVPILLGTFVITAGVADAARIYNVIVVVVAFSVIVQGGLVPLVARWCSVPMRVVEPEPWSLGMRFREEPDGLHRYVVAPGSVADGHPLGDLPLDDLWISMISRNGQLVQVRRDTTLQAGDEVLALIESGGEDDPGAIFGGRGGPAA
jgi:cell volume regulation protein A